ncbi:Phage Tail Collar Domain [Paenibacillaceae bacterium GAS479]|nr:Phage Tail Collar Domain [Paenibacillaceae bacterium GAS479]
MKLHYQGWRWRRWLSLTLIIVLVAGGLVLPPKKASAAAQAPYLAEVALFPYKAAPRGWTYSDGRLLLISQNHALFSLIGTMYGGNGVTTFILPDLRSAALDMLRVTYLAFSRVPLCIR